MLVGIAIVILIIFVFPYFVNKAAKKEEQRRKELEELRNELNEIGEALAEARELLNKYKARIIAAKRAGERRNKK